MSSEAKREDDSILFSIACHQGIEAVSGTNLIVNCFRRLGPSILPVGDVSGA